MMNSPVNISKEPWRWNSVPKGCGVIVIRQRSSGKAYYVGATNVRQRAYDHHRLLCSGEHHNHHLQLDWAYNPQDFEITVAERVPDAALVPLFTRVWIERTAASTYNLRRPMPVRNRRRSR